MTDSHFHESYDAVASWPLARTLAANDLIDEFAAMAHRAHEAARIEAEERRGRGS